MSCCSCLSWCKPKTAPPQAKEVPAKYSENKSITVQPVIPIAARHERVLSTMHIKDGRVVITHSKISDAESDRIFGRTLEKVDERATVRFAPEHESGAMTSRTPRPTPLELSAS